MATATIKKCHLRMNNCTVVTLKFWFSPWRSRLQLKSPVCTADWIKHCCRLKSRSNLQSKNYVTSKLCNKRLLSIKTTKKLCNAWVQTIFYQNYKCGNFTCCFTEDGAPCTHAACLCFLSIIHLWRYSHCQSFLKNRKDDAFHWSSHTAFHSNLRLKRLVFCFPLWG